MALPPITIKIGAGHPSAAEQICAQKQATGRSATSQPIAAPKSEAPATPAPVRPIDFAIQLGAAMYHAEEERKAKTATQRELDAARYSPDDSPGLSLAEQRRRFEREQIGASIVPLEISGQSLFAKRFNFGEVLYLTLLLPLGESGFLDAMRPDELAFAAVEMLRLGLCRDGSGNAYFDNRGDAVAYVDDDATADFASATIMAIDDLNRIFPRRPGDEPPPRKTPAQERLERLKAKSAPDGPKVSTQTAIERIAQLAAEHANAPHVEAEPTTKPKRARKPKAAAPETAKESNDANT